MFIAKIARFQFEAEATENEIKIYNILHDHRFNLALQVAGLIYEETIDRTIGILILMI